jgi:hypothetical protein
MPAYTFPSPIFRFGQSTSSNKWALKIQSLMWARKGADKKKKRCVRLRPHPRLTGRRCSPFSGAPTFALLPYEYCSHNLRPPPHKYSWNHRINQRHSITANCSETAQLKSSAAAAAAAGYKAPKMPSAKHTLDCSQRYLSLGVIPNPHLSSSFISAIPHTHLPNMLGTATSSDPLDLWALNRISFKRISLDLLDSQSSSWLRMLHWQLIGLVCKLYYPPVAYLFASNKTYLCCHCQFAIKHWQVALWLESCSMFCPSDIIWFRGALSSHSDLFGFVGLCVLVTQARRKRLSSRLLTMDGWQQFLLALVHNLSSLLWVFIVWALHLLFS